MRVVLADDSVLLREGVARILEESGVAVTPGVDFDPPRGHYFIRLSFAGPSEEVERAAERLCAWFRAERSRAR